MLVCGRGLVGPVQLADDRRIVDRNHGAVGLRDRSLNRVVGLRFAEDVERERIGGDGTARGGAAGDGGIGGHGAERSAGAGGNFGEREVEAADHAAALGAQQFGIADGQQVALELDIEIVLDGERERVLQREVEIAGADEFVDARRVLRTHRRSACAECRSGRARDRRLGTAPERRRQACGTFSGPTASCRPRPFRRPWPPA